PENPFGSVISTLGAPTMLPAMHVQLAVVADCNLMHIYETRKTSFADVFVVNYLDNSVCFCRLAERSFVCRLGLSG
ncbi:hypothetical protein, partial [Litoreibacter halocynthiae]|uniref:hypothetical protein n=1 Tax=Litoreibacter halocynthiae TaxID=1242689 RepID=UPI0024931A77